MRTVHLPKSILVITLIHFLKDRSYILQSETACKNQDNQNGKTLTECIRPTNHGGIKLEATKQGIEKRLEELRIELPVLTDIKQPFCPGTIVGSLVILSGQTPRVNGKQKYVGTVGTSEITIDEAREAARVCALNLLSALKATVGDLNKVKRIVKMNGYVAATSDFTEHPFIINAASDLLNEIFGSQHARIAVGLSSLPGGAPVELELIAELEE